MNQQLFFSFDYLNEGGNFVAKVLAGGAEMELQNILKENLIKFIISNLNQVDQTVLKNML